MSSGILKAALCAAMLLLPMNAYAVDWNKVSGKDVVLFYPAQMSWEMLLTQSDHSGAGKFREGKNCAGCHEGEERASGKLLVGDKSVEATPIPGKPGFVMANVKTAHDGESIFVRVEFDPGQQPNAGLDKEFATKVAVMIDDGKVPEAGRAGCWATCHDNLTRMPSAGAGETTKYLTRSRVAMTRKGGTEIKPAAELEKIRAEGGYLEYWQARLNAGRPPVAVDGTILDKRAENASPAVSVEAQENGSKWTVTFSRKMTAGGPYKDLVAGKPYTIGISLHAGHAAQRFHYVSLEKTLAVDSGKADFVAARN
ncbi:MAG: ethylbenzene dehydrogenase-related protein [Rhodospirillaceae bacterium]